MGKLQGANMKTVCVCYAKDYDLARATARPGDIFLFDANSGPVPDAPDVWPTTFRRPGNIVGRECISALWSTYLDILDYTGADTLFSRPADTRILRPELYKHTPGHHLVGVSRDETPSWRQWGCGQHLTRLGIKIALGRLPNMDLPDCGTPGLEHEDLALSWVLRDVALGLASFRECFYMRGQRPTPHTAFINFDNFDPMRRPRRERHPVVLDAALNYRTAIPGSHNV